MIYNRPLARSRPPARLPSRLGPARFAPTPLTKPMPFSSLVAKIRTFPLVKVLPCLVCLALGTLVAAKVADPPAKQLATYATAAVESFDASQHDELILPFDSADRTGWHFIPKDDRKGIPLDEMNDAQRTATLRLVRAALSEMGYRKATDIRMIEAVVAELEGNDRRWARDPMLYYLTLFGTPSDQGTWGMSFEGHHLSINLVCRDGEVVDSTPQFMGAHPATMPEKYAGGFSGGTRILADEEDLGFRWLRSLDDDQRAVAIISAEAPAETRFAGKAQADVEGEPVGLAYAKMSTPSKSLVQRLVRLYVDAVAGPIAEARWQTVTKDGWDDVHVAWAGATEPGKGHYYRIRGKSFLIELVNSQPDAEGNPANHMHCVYRDLTGDFDLPRS